MSRDVGVAAIYVDARQARAPDLWVPEMLCAYVCDLLVLVDQVSESGPPPDAVRAAFRELGERS